MRVRDTRCADAAFLAPLPPLRPSSTLTHPDAASAPPPYRTRTAAVPQTYVRDVFVFLFLVLTAVAGAYTLKQHRGLLLHRTQTEEWKGWMQVRVRVCV